MGGFGAGAGGIHGHERGVHRAPGIAAGEGRGRGASEKRGRRERAVAAARAAGCTTWVSHTASPTAHPLHSISHTHTLHTRALHPTHTRTLPLPPCPQANWLRAAGVKKGDAVAVYMPMLLELPLAMLACARIGAVHSVVFGGFSAESLAQRMEDCKAKVGA